ncbi:MAG: helix-turn-helix transcriptional regulator [Cyanobacteria bacterium J06621_8]
MNDKTPIAVEQGRDNVFIDLGFEPEMAANLKIRADLILALQKYIKEKNWNQEQAANFFQETQPRISNLMNGDIDKFSIDKLVTMIIRAGMQIKIEVITKAA